MAVPLPIPAVFSRKKPSGCGSPRWLVILGQIEATVCPSQSDHHRACLRAADSLQHIHLGEHCGFQACITTCSLSFKEIQLYFDGGLPPTFSLSLKAALESSEEPSLGSTKQTWGPSAPIVQRWSVDLASKQGYKHS